MISATVFERLTTLCPDAIEQARADIVMGKMHHDEIYQRLCADVAATGIRLTKAAFTQFAMRAKLIGENTPAAEQGSPETAWPVTFKTEPTGKAALRLRAVFFPGGEQHALRAFFDAATEAEMDSFGADALNDLLTHMFGDDDQARLGAAYSLALLYCLEAHDGRR